ncbi:hypothetical protein NKR19_g5266 [Coniochaeta hoffmannii]|uniref:Uncharacterized protein n=1 Tax=Coniochaeta hoffmannii TaxID=91930 RepID=A0AA38S4L6_9PEZI|nr:hypothetical protein NKR19_g5266 [Coniochaeta hoffmannii]
MARKCAILTLLLGFAHCNDGIVASPTGPSAPLPDVEVASRSPNAFRIFNAVHSALRQWGSSIQHNGLSFFPVTIPEGNLFYHGRHDTERPETFEWLAFEMEHASQFAQCWDFDDPSPSTSMLSQCFKLVQGLSVHGRVATADPKVRPSSGFGRHRGTTIPDDDDDDQHALTGDDDDDNLELPPSGRRPRPPKARGYLQTYRAARPLNLLYLDGMAAAKCRLGTLDSQNSILLDWTEEADPMRDEWERTEALCALARSWGGVDGFVRMEAGFEIIYCNFTRGAGLDLISTRGSPFRNETHASAGEGEGGEWFVMGVLEWMRASAARYGGFPRARAEVDFSGMVSAFMYDVNTTNPDPERQDLPRIVSTGADARHGIRDRVRESVRARKGKASSTIEWQAVVDNIVTRFAARLWFLSENPPSARPFRSQLATLLYPFLDFPDDISLDDVSEPVQRCTEIHLSPVVTAGQSSWTPEDRAIHAAIRTVSHEICSSLFAMRREIHTTNGTTSGDDDAARRVQGMARELRGRLDWTAWKECARCAEPEEMCFVAMFPAGDREDHFAPRCKRQDEIGFGYFVDVRW